MDLADAVFAERAELVVQVAPLLEWVGEIEIASGRRATPISSSSATCASASRRGLDPDEGERGRPGLG